MRFPYEAVLFDWAYTLVDLVEEDDRKAFRVLSDFMKEHDIYVGDFEEIYESCRKMFYEMINLSRQIHREACFEQVLKYLLIQLGVSRNGNNVTRKLLEVYYKSLYKPRKVYPDSIPTLQALKDGGVRLGVISNTTNPRFMKDWERKAMGLDEFFELSIYSSEVPYRKPHPSIFELARHRFNLKPTEILFVGDNLYADILGAQGIGMRAVWLNRKGLKNSGSIKPDYEIQSLIHLTKVITKAKGME